MRTAPDSLSIFVLGKCASRRVGKGAVMPLQIGGVESDWRAALDASTVR
jgi:hypothetical protein